jgi:hypothetical protein
MSPDLSGRIGREIRRDFKKCFLQNEPNILSSNFQLQAFPIGFWPGEKSAYYVKYHLLKKATSLRPQLESKGWPYKCLFVFGNFKFISCLEFRICGGRCGDGKFC